MIFWISPVSPVAFLTSSGWRGLSRSVGLMPRTPQGLCTDQRKQWLSGSRDRFPSVEPFLFWVLRSDHCALVLQCDSRRKGVANVKIISELFIRLCSICLKSSEQLTRHVAHSLTSFWPLGCRLLEKGFPDHLFYIATHPCPNPDPASLDFSPEPLCMHTHTHTHL